MDTITNAVRLSGQTGNFVYFWAFSCRPTQNLRELRMKQHREKMSDSIERSIKLLTWLYDSNHADMLLNADMLSGNENYR